jgi:hypothetical protein
VGLAVAAVAASEAAEPAEAGNLLQLPECSLSLAANPLTEFIMIQLQALVKILTGQFKLALFFVQVPNLQSTVRQQVRLYFAIKPKNPVECSNSLFRLSQPLVTSPFPV